MWFLDSLSAGLMLVNITGRLNRVVRDIGSVWGYWVVHGHIRA